MPAQSSLPLDGVRVLELAGLAPAPFAGLVLADFGADVVRVDRAGASSSVDVLTRGKRSIAVSLQSPQGIALLRQLLSAPTGNEQDWRADVLIDPFRPGVLERLGLDPKELLERNPRLVIVRLTGFRREGPYAKMAGHDINYLALSGVLSMLGRKGEKPYAPANTLSDFAGGGLLAALGVMAALLERARSGKGQIVETDMVTGTRYAAIFPLLMSRPSLGLPMWDQPRGENVLDGGAPWYDVYETKDGKYMSMGPIENHFYAAFLKLFISALPPSVIPSPPPAAADQLDRTTWPSLTAFLTRGFLTRTRNEWTQLFLGTDACCVPVLDKAEIDADGVGPFEEERGLSKEETQAGDGGVPIPAPRLSRTPAGGRAASSIFLEPGAHTQAVLEEAGLGGKMVELLRVGAVSSGGGAKAKL
ncbi:hypothetical protein JCM6882_003266 [Rhodosporidiobolus microsporus]